MRCYIALLHRAEAERARERERYRVELPDFPGCAAWAESLLDSPSVAMRMLVEKAERHRAAGQPIPRPSAPEAVAAQAARAGAVPVVVPLPMLHDDRVSVSLDLPAGLVERVDRRARSHGVARAELLEKAARLALWETGRREPPAGDGRIGK